MMQHWSQRPSGLITPKEFFWKECGGLCSGSCHMTAEADLSFGNQRSHDWRDYPNNTDMAGTLAHPELLKFDEVNGDWSNLSTELRVTGTNAQLIAQTPSRSYQMRVGGQFFGNHGDQFRIIACWEDANNYLYAEATISSSAAGSGSVGLYRMQGGVATQLGLETFPGNWLWFNAFVGLSLCVQGTIARVYLSMIMPMIGASVMEPTVVPIIVPLGYTPTGKRWGFGTGATATDVRGRRVFLADMQDAPDPGVEGTTPEGNCIDCFACQLCVDRLNVPHAYLVEIGGALSGVSHCGATNCGALVGQYTCLRASGYDDVLDDWPFPTYGISGGYWFGLAENNQICQWTYRFPGGGIPLGGSCGTAKSISVFHGWIKMTTNHFPYGTAVGIGLELSGKMQTFSVAHIDHRAAVFANILQSIQDPVEPDIDCDQPQTLAQLVASHTGGSPGYVPAQACKPGLTCSITPLWF